jgi:CDP-glucose 4,6-dehydratase
MEQRQSSLESLVNSKFWQGKRTLITGHTGFKGSWLTLWLYKLGANITGFSIDVPTKPSLFELIHIKDEINSVIGDIRNFEHIKDVVEEFRPQIVIHMAAQSLVRVSYQNPRETFETNIMGTVNLLDALRQIACAHVIINVTSDKCYENSGLNNRYTEGDPMGGYDPYSNSKGSSELVTSSYRNSFFNIDKFDSHKVGLASVRAGNVIGGGDWSKDRLMTDIMNSLINDVEIKIRNPDAIRPWQHVLDPLNGYIMLAEKLWSDGQTYSEAWNFGPEEEKPVSWILNKVSQLYGKPVKYSIDKSDQPHEAMVLRLDCNKAMLKLGWKPKMNLELGLKYTVDWYKHYENQDDMRKITENQIDTFSLT